MYVEQLNCVKLEFTVTDISQRKPMLKVSEARQIVAARSLFCITRSLSFTFDAFIQVHVDSYFMPMCVVRIKVYV